MTYETTRTGAAPASGDESSPSKVDEAKEVAGRAVDRANDVAGEAGAQAKAVVRDAKGQARDLVGRGREHLEEEARSRGRQAAGGLRTFADQLGALSQGDQQGAGALGDYVSQGREQLTRLADRLEDGPAAVLDDVRRFARRQPVVFLAAAGALGFVAGRLVRGARDASQAPDAPTARPTASGAVSTPVLPVTSGEALMPPPPPVVPPATGGPVVPGGGVAP
jgi:hypothetical protein